MEFPAIRYSQLKYYHFMDANDHEIGNLDDLVLDENNLQVTHLILGGGFFEEFLESKGVLDDIDEIVPLSEIQSIEDDYVILSKPLEKLIKTGKDSSLPVTGIRFSEICRYTLQDPTGTIDATIYDLIVDDGVSKLIISYQDIGSQIKSEGFQQRFDISIPSDKFEQVGSTILKIPYSRDKIIEIIRQNSEPKMRGKSLVDIDTT